MTATAQTTPQEEAISLLSEVLSGLTGPGGNIKVALRKCLLVCEMLGWRPQRDWFHQELNGYYPTSALPTHRKVSGKCKWQPAPSFSDTVNWKSEEMVYGANPAVYEEEEDVLEIWAGIEFFIAYTSTGYTEILQETKKVPSPSGHRSITFQRARIFTASAIAASLTQIERFIFDFASRAYVQLKYGNAVGDIWSQYRIKVDAGLASLDLAKHLNVIELSLQSTNPEAWRTAILECRNLLNDLANYLWRDGRPRYEYLPGRTDEDTLDVTKGKFGNRLAAYIHQKGLSGTRGKYLRNEADRLATSIQSLIAFQSEAHEPISLQDARSVVIAMYVLVGEIIGRTDLNPIVTYGKPVIQGVPPTGEASVG